MIINPKAVLAAAIVLLAGTLPTPAWHWSNSMHRKR